MRVDRIYTRSIVGTPRSSSLAEAAALMRKFHVGALLVTDDAPEEGEAVGMITDRDVVVQAVARGFDVNELRVGDVMTPTIASIGCDADLHEALEVMREAGVRRLVVSEEGRVVGMLSMDDVIDGLAVDLTSLAGLLHNEVEREREELDAYAANDEDGVKP